MIKVRKDLTGQIFGKLKVLYQGEDHITSGGNHFATWVCECQCEKKTILTVKQADLKSGHTKSCGCYHKERMKETRSKQNKYDLTGEYGIGWATNTNNVFYFDLEDYDKIKDMSWWENNYGYMVHSTKTNYKIHMHSLISGYEFTDHINRNRLDNRKENLRKSIRHLNVINRFKTNKNTSGFIGVYPRKEGDKWRVQIGFKLDNKYYKIYLGQFEDIIEALRLRLQAEYDIQGSEYAPQRHLFEQYNIPDSNLHKIIYDKLEKHGKLDCLKQQE